MKHRIQIAEYIGVVSIFIRVPPGIHAFNSKLFVSWSQFVAHKFWWFPGIVCLLVCLLLFFLVSTRFRLPYCKFLFSNSLCRIEYISRFCYIGIPNAIVKSEKMCHSYSNIEFSIVLFMACVPRQCLSCNNLVAFKKRAIRLVSNNCSKLLSWFICNSKRIDARIWVRIVGFWVDLFILL